MTKLVWAPAGPHEETAEVEAYPPWWVRVSTAGPDAWHLQRTLPNEPGRWRYVSRHGTREEAKRAAETMAGLGTVIIGGSPDEFPDQIEGLQRSVARVTGYQYGDYPWDRWQRTALEAGLAPELAQLGRAVMREAAQHAWDEDLCQEVGWHDDGAWMLRRALKDPDQLRQRWQHLLDTDGERIPPPST